MVYRRLKRKPALSRNLLLKNIVIRHSASLSFYFRIMLGFWCIKILLGLRSNERDRLTVRGVFLSALIPNAGIFSKIFRIFDAVGIFQLVF